MNACRISDSMADLQGELVILWEGVMIFLCEFCSLGLTPFIEKKIIGQDKIN